MPERQEGGGMQLPAAPQKTPGLPENFELYTFDGFEGLNTKATRPAIKDQQMAYSDNFMPLGPNNLRTMYDIGVSLYSATGGLTINYFDFANIGSTAVCMVFLSDGSIVQVNTATKAVTTVASAGAIADPTQQIGVSQFGSQYIVICAPQSNGYFNWDGTTFYHTGSLGPAVTISNSGLDYTSSPTITARGGSGTGATFSATIASGGAISAITVTNAGSGYSASDAVYLSFSGGGPGTAATAVATATVTNGAVASIAMSVNGSGYNQTSTRVSIQGGGGINAAATATVSSGAVTAITVTSGGTAFTSVPSVIITDPFNAVAQATVSVMPFGVQGTAVETYVSRVWLVNGLAPTTPPNKNIGFFTTAASPTDFNTNDGGGNFIGTDSFLRVGWNALKQLSGFLYLLGDSSVNTISGVQTLGVPPTTTFNNQNVDPQVGTPWPDTIQVFKRAVIFANTFGVHAIYGGAVEKVSDDLDGIFTTVTPTGNPPKYSGNMAPSSALATIFGIQVYVLLLPIIDPDSNAQRNALLCWDGRKWWTASQSVTLTRISSQEINSVLTAYGTDGGKIYPLFQTASNAITKKVKSKQWTRPHYLITKNVQGVLGLFQSNANDAVGFSISVDTENGSLSVSQTNLFGASWTASGGASVSWTATGMLAVTWQATGQSLFDAAVNAQGRVCGMTLSTTSMDYTLISLAMRAQQYKPNL